MRGIYHQLQLTGNPKSMHDKIEQLKQNCSHIPGAADAMIHYEVITLYAQRTFEDMSDYISKMLPFLLLIRQQFIHLLEAQFRCQSIMNQKSSKK